ncbi:hypothetical protein MVEN_01138700 [Mycena venus]|uniref:Uncharacterized protein n=1 Tax=Mycena venus TaxID=2733690 RepID=A0A8H6Y8R5_9AGAR|nr:hypothetical protein MVEN_01138700 [Mycena venus]
MPDPALVDTSKDASSLFSIHPGEPIALLGPFQPAKEELSTSRTAIEKECQLAATASLPKDAFPELKIAYSACLSPHPIRNAVSLPDCGHNFCHSCLESHFDIEIINHRFLYPDWDRPAQIFDADFSPETPPPQAHSLSRTPSSAPLSSLQQTCERSPGT